MTRHYLLPVSGFGDYEGPDAIGFEATPACLAAMRSLIGLPVPEGARLVHFEVPDAVTVRAYRFAKAFDADGDDDLADAMIDGEPDLAERAWVERCLSPDDEVDLTLIASVRGGTIDAVGFRVGAQFRSAYLEGSGREMLDAARLDEIGTEIASDAAEA